MDLAARDPEKVTELTGLYTEWAKRCGVETWPVKK